MLMIAAARLLLRKEPANNQFERPSAQAPKAGFNFRTNYCQLGRLPVVIPTCAGQIGCK